VYIYVLKEATGQPGIEKGKGGGTFGIKVLYIDWSKFYIGAELGLVAELIYKN